MLLELKQVIGSMKSQIKGDVVDTFQQQLSIIENQYAEKSEIISVIKMMQSMGRYLGSKKNNAHEDTVPLLESIANSLEELVRNPDLTKEQINQILSGCIENYKSLKNKIAFQPIVTVTEIQNLKAVILAVDWEISDSTLKTFDMVTSQLLIQLKPHKILHAFLRIIHSMGQYIASKKANAHKDSIFFLRSVFKNFEKIVQTPDMPFQEKKHLIESDINAFHNFKRETASVKKTIPVFTDKTEDEIIQPALSHIKASPRPVAEDVVPLSRLSQEETSLTGQSQDSENLTPALTGRKKSVPAPRDVMDELFSLKESPADELLDAIHLADIHGPGQTNSMKMDEQTKADLQKEGIKSFTPRRMSNKPIPEIGNRLDEFFNLDISEDNNVTKIQENNQSLAFDDKNDLSAPDDSSMEAIVPFQYEDESVEENLDDDDPAQAAIDRLKSLAKTHHRLLEDKSLTAIDEDISCLKPLWQDDPDKTMLIDIISWLIQSIKDQPISDQATPNQAESDKLDSRSLGFWGKIKSLFSS